MLRSELRRRSVRSVMISCVHRRNTERPRTLDQLANAGLNPVVIESACDPAGGPLNRLAAYQALQVLGSDGGLFFEDDIDVNAALFTKVIDLVVPLSKVTTLFVPKRWSLHPTEVLTALAGRTPIPLRVLPLVNTRERRGFYGTQAMYLPGDFVLSALRCRNDFMTPDGLPLSSCDGFDFWIKEHAQEIYGAFPNPVQHRNPPKMRSVTRGMDASQGQNHTSLTFGWEVA